MRPIRIGEEAGVKEGRRGNSIRIGESGNGRNCFTEFNLSVSFIRRVYRRVNNSLAALL